MKYYGYKFLLFILRGLRAIKKGFLSLWHFLGPFVSFVGTWYQKVIGFRIFKVGFILRKKLQKYKIPKDNRLVDSITSRFVLQFVFFIAVLIIALPQSKLYPTDAALATSHETLLYTLIGPGNQDFDSQELVINSVESPFVTPSRQDGSWDMGVIGANNTSQLGNNSNINFEPEDIVSISSGGSAIVKPSILTGSVLPIEQTPTVTEAAQGRNKMVQYEVRSGDVIGAISSRFGLKVATLLWANNLNSRSYIRPGDILKIPPGDGVMYTVRRGDTVGKIAREFDASQSEIIAFNNIGKEGANISIGDEIFIPNAQISESSRETSIAVAPSKIVQTIRKIAAPPPSIDTPAGSGYVWPTKDHRINQYYGLRHTGVDIHGVIGNPNYAARAGKVIKSQCGWNGGYGCYIILDHGSGITTLYGHNSKLLVSVGDQVDQGQVIGLLGSTGRSTGPHLHFEVRVNNRRSNPLQYIR